jgi:hypothetical protein
MRRCGRRVLIAAIAIAIAALAMFKVGRWSGRRRGGEL